MKWEESRQSDYVEDRRGSGQYAGGGGSSGHLGLGAMIVLGLIGYAFGIDPRLLIGGAEMVSKVTSKPQQAAPAGQVGAPKDQMGRFVAAVLAENEDVWKEVLPAQTGVKFTPAPIVLFNRATQSACGTAQSAMGPFYCPLDKKIYRLKLAREDVRRCPCYPGNPAAIGSAPRSSALQGTRSKPGD